MEEGYPSDSTLGTFPSTADFELERNSSHYGATIHSTTILKPGYDPEMGGGQFGGSQTEFGGSGGTGVTSFEQAPGTSGSWWTSSLVLVGIFVLVCFVGLLIYMPGFYLNGVGWGSFSQKCMGGFEDAAIMLLCCV